MRAGLPCRNVRLCLTRIGQTGARCRVVRSSFGKPRDIPILAGWPLRMSKPSGQRRRHIFPNMFLPPGFDRSLRPTGRRLGMDFEEEGLDRRAIAAGDPLPPDDWAAFGNNARVEALYVSQRSHVAGIFRRSVPPQEVADLVQETFRRLFSAKGDGAGLLEAPGAYLAAAARTILKNRARSGVRNHVQAHHSFEDHEVSGPDPHAVLEQRDTIRRVEDAIARLSETTRDVFLMHRFDDLSYSEIARIKGMKIKRVEKHIAKALVAVRKARDTQP